MPYFHEIKELLAIFFTILALSVVIYFLLRKKNTNGDRKKTVSIMTVLGSGGHTAEMLTLLETLSDHYSPRYYVMANNDEISEVKIISLESTQRNEYVICKIPRCREVKQSWLTTVLSFIYATMYSFPLVFKIRPDIILCNGPGTCIPICLAGILLKVLYSIKVVYVESICRVETLSLSAKILYHLADGLIVQWPQLQKMYPKTKYLEKNKST